jgi:DNA-binding transcriptional MocR family regulator
MLRLRVVGIPADHDGLIPDALAHACKTQRPKVLLTTPTLQNPTGSIMSATRRRRVAAVIADRGMLVLEDDVYGPLVPNAPRPLSALVPEHAYYVSTLSKTVTPALRTAFVVAPTTSHISRLTPYLVATGGLAPPTMSEIAARWIGSQVAGNIVADRRREAHARQGELHDALGLPANTDALYALHHWLQLPAQWERTSDFVDALRGRGVLVTSGDAFSVDSARPTRAVRISLGSAPSRAALSAALETIATLMGEDPEPTRPAR